MMGNKPMSYSQAAQEDWTVVTPKRGKTTVQNKPQKPEKLVQALYPKAEREIVIYFDKNTGLIPTGKLTRDALNMVNRALVANKGVLFPPFLWVMVPTCPSSAMRVGMGLATDILVFTFFY
jgi:hypothetical protein